MGCGPIHGFALDECADITLDVACLPSVPAKTHTVPPAMTPMDALTLRGQVKGLC
jgi:hypothetical protein